MTFVSRDRYLELLRDSLTFALWDEPPVPIEMFNPARAPAKRLVAMLLSRLAALGGLKLVRPMPIPPEAREDGRYWPLCAHTMVGKRRLDNLRMCVESVVLEDIPGDLVEAGVWRGGSAIFMKGVLESLDARARRLFVADSFQGLPAPDIERYPADAGDRHSTFEYLSVDRQEVEDNFRKFGLLDDSVIFVEGWFKDTLHRLASGRFSVIRLDGDMYESTMDALIALYPRLSPGGYCIIDDYALQGCRRATDEYRERHGIEDEIKGIDWTGVFWRRSG